MRVRLFIVHLGVIISVMIMGSLSSCKEDEAVPEISVKDLDGNTYTTIKIGTQVWTVENLKVTKYRNGDPIPNITDDEAWGNLTSGAYCNLGNDPNQAAVYGRLYNWAAVNDPRQLAPLGWHVPTDDEWTTLIAYLGGEAVAGGKMKETGSGHWCSPNVGATNESGFTAVPAGVRSWEYGFLMGCDWGLLWSATEAEPTTAYHRFLFSDDAGINRVDNNKKSGMSVRCIKD